MWSELGHWVGTMLRRKERVCVGGGGDVGQETRVQAANDKEKLEQLWGTGINLGL